MSNSAAAGKEPPHKKRTMSRPPSTSPMLTSMLPHDVVLNCLARVSKTDHGALSLVSRSHRSLVASPDLYKTRSLLGCTENYLYVCMLIPSDTVPRWFILHRGKSVERLLRPIRSLPFQPRVGSSVVAVDWGIYVIGGHIVGKSTSSVRLLDCRTHTWRRSPSMRVARSNAAAGVVGGKIYVFGGCNSDSNWLEVFDPKTQTWETLLSKPDQTICSQCIHDSVVVREEKEKVYALYGLEHNKTFYYSPSESKWARGNNSPQTRNGSNWRAIDKSIYYIDRRGILWWCEAAEEGPERKEMYWRTVKGLGSLTEIMINIYGTEKELIDLLPQVRLCNFGPNIVLFWAATFMERKKRCRRYRHEIWCAEISLELRQGPEMWGNLEWSNAVMTLDCFPDSFKIFHSVSVTL